MKNVARQPQFPAVSLELPTAERLTGDALDRIDDPTASPARVLQARVLAYAHGAQPHHHQYPGWIRLAILLGGIALGWGLVALAVLPLLG